MFGNKRSLMNITKMNKHSNVTFVRALVNIIYSKTFKQENFQDFSLIYEYFPRKYFKLFYKLWACQEVI